MQAWQLRTFGPEGLTLAELPIPEAGPGDVLVRFEAASVNPRDQQIVSGQFAPHQSLPLIPLSDGAGRVIDTGSGVTRVAPGDRVMPLFFPEWLHGGARRRARCIRRAGGSRCIA